MIPEIMGGGKATGVAVTGLSTFAAATLSTDAIPAIAAACVAALAAVWTLYQFARDKRVMMAERDARELYNQLVEARIQLATVKVENAELKAHLKANLLHDEPQ